MKTISAIFALALLLFAQVQAQTPAEVPSAPLTTVTFSETVYNFGEVEQNTPVTHKFIVTNTGTSDLIINEVKRTCSCTGLEWSKEPIKPGQTGWVDATFNAAHPGPFTKTLYFNANIDPNPVGLTFQGEVKPRVEMNLSGGTMMDAQPVPPSGGH